MYSGRWLKTCIPEKYAPLLNFDKFIIGRCRFLLWLVLYLLISLFIYTGCPGGNVPDFGRMFLRLKYTDITKNTYIRSRTATEIKASEKCGLLAVPRTVPGSRDVLPIRCACPSLSTAGSSALHAATAHVKCLEP